MEIRNFRWDDLLSLVHFMHRYAEAYGQVSSVTLEQVERSWRAPHNRPEENAFIALDSDSKILGYTIADLLDEPNYAFGVYQVLPREVESGRALMKAATDYFREVALTKNPAEVPIIIDWRISEKDTAAVNLCKEEKLEQVRQFYTMRIALDQLIPTTTLPTGFTRKPFTSNDLDAVFETKVEIFEDHWGGQYDTLDEWRHRIEQPTFNPDLWWVIYDDNQIAGILLSQPVNAETGDISIVGVRRSWRKRGLAQAMLHQCFTEYQRLGFKDVFLGVDSNSQTNAVRLYQRVGMDIHRTILYYRDYIRR
jgi:mycothiol synthase